jgi:fermentation-respiration switch protein FrsA (DUF1100 family)
MSRAGTLAAWPETRVGRAMRAWRRGAGPLEPWFRATPFAAACHYRDRSLSIDNVGAPPRAVERLLDFLPSPERGTLWIFDLPGPLAIWLAYALRRRRALTPALVWNGWYDPRGALEGREEIPLLLALGAKLEQVPARGAYLLLDTSRHSEPRPARLDNRYALSEEDVPTHAHLAQMGVKRALVWCWNKPAEDLAAYLAFLARRLRVTVTAKVARKVGVDG